MPGGTVYELQLSLFWGKTSESGAIFTWGVLTWAIFPISRCFALPSIPLIQLKKNRHLGSSSYFYGWKKKRCFTTNQIIIAIPIIFPLYYHDLPFWLLKLPFFMVKSYAELPERGPIAPPSHDGAMPNTPLQGTAKGHGAGLGDQW